MRRQDFSLMSKCIFWQCKEADDRQQICVCASANSHLELSKVAPSFAELDALLQVNPTLNLGNTLGFYDGESDLEVASAHSLTLW